MQVPGIPQAVVDVADDSLGEKAYLALDPVDGTTNFACGGPDWGVSATIHRSSAELMEKRFRRRG